MELKKSVHAGMIVKQAPGSDPRVLRFIASNESPDRDNDIIDSNGWNLQNFQKNPVFLWAHDYNLPPLGKVVHCEKDIRNRQLIADVRFASMAEMAPDGNPSEHAKFTETIFNLYKNGYLNAVSVGCKYLKSEPRNDGQQADIEMYRRGIHVMEAELWELSGCPVPSNQDAMLQASSIPGVEKSALEMVIKSIKEVEEKAAIPFKHYPLADEAQKWDGPAVVAASEVEDLKQIATWYDSSKADADLTKGDFKMPHHMTKSDGYKTVWAGVRAAAGTLFGSRSGVDIPDADKEKVKAHLKKHYVEFDKPWPEDEKAWTDQEKAYEAETQKEVKPEVQKEGRRLSKASIALIDELKNGLVEFDEAIESLKGCRTKMDARIKALENGSSEEPDEDDMEGDDTEKGVIIRFVD